MSRIFGTTSSDMRNAGAKVTRNTAVTTNSMAAVRMCADSRCPSEPAATSLCVVIFTSISALSLITSSTATTRTSPRYVASVTCAVDISPTLDVMLSQSCTLPSDLTPQIKYANFYSTYRTNWNTTSCKVASSLIFLSSNTKQEHWGRADVHQGGRIGRAGSW